MNSMNIQNHTSERAKFAKKEQLSWASLRPLLLIRSPISTFISKRRSSIDVPTLLLRLPLLPMFLHLPDQGTQILEPLIHPRVRILRRTRRRSLIARIQGQRTLPISVQVCSSTLPLLLLLPIPPLFRRWKRRFRFGDGTNEIAIAIAIAIADGGWCFVGSRS